MYTFLNVKSGQPVTEQEAGAFPVKELSGGQAAVDWLRYEDTDMTIGSYLSALSHRAKVEPGAQVAAALERAFRCVRRIYDMSAAFKEPGWLCKPYGGRASDESTNDQYGAVVLGLRDATSITGWKFAHEAREMAISLCDYWVRHDYVCPYAGNPNHRWLNRLPWAFVCLSLVRIAYALTRNKKYADEAERISALGFDSPAPRSGAFRTDLYPSEMHRGVRLLSNYHHLVVEHLDAMCETWPARTQHWQNLLADFWERDINMGMDSDGIAYGGYEVDLRTNRWKPMAAGWLPGHETPGKRPGWPGNYWVGRIKSGSSTCYMACSAIKVGHRVRASRDDCRRVALKILETIQEDQMVWVIDAEGNQECPE
ncbi:MAG: hypothetical protein HY646_18380, partial [Acidobacteria bacterium]|nr:hypothetical protein [Acidobacteriota bacterium]